MNKYAIIVAGGKGLRMGSDIPKQFLLLNGLPVLMHTLNAFSNIIGIHLILVLPTTQIAYWNALCLQYQFQVKHQLIAGGETRFHSVRNGLAAIKDLNSLVAIHDGVRPLIKQEIILKSFEIAQEKGNVIAVVKLKDSIRKVELLSNRSVNRDNYYLVQTPQTFQSKIIKECYLETDHYNFTDDAAVLEEAGHKINLMEGDYRNIKITSPEDLLVAAALLN